MKAGLVPMVAAVSKGPLEGVGSTAKRAAANAASAVATCAAALLCMALLAALLSQQSGSAGYFARSGWAPTRQGPPRLPAPGAGSNPPLPRPPPPPPPAPPHCSFNGTLPLWSVQWSKADGKADQLSVRGCTMRRFGPAEAKRCLAGKRLVFVGDSVTRYQYLTLLHFLDRGAWPPPFGGVPGEPSVANEHEWPSWNDFLRGTNALFGGRELCDCFRAEAEPGSLQKPAEDEKHENRFYRRRLRAGEGGGEISVTHLTYTTFPNQVHGHYGFPPYAKGRQPCAPATCSAPADWAHHLAEALAGPVKDLRPTHLMVNSGLWGSSNGLPGWPRVAAAGRAAVAPQVGRAIWRTTTANRGRKFPVHPGHDAQAVQHTLAAGWALMDAYSITRPLLGMKPRPMWDPRHFHAVVYRELNQYLLNIICPHEGGECSSGDGGGSSSGGEADSSSETGSDGGGGSSSGGGSDRPVDGVERAEKAADGAEGPD